LGASHFATFPLSSQAHPPIGNSTCKFPALYCTPPSRPTYTSSTTTFNDSNSTPNPAGSSQLQEDITSKSTRGGAKVLVVASIASNRRGLFFPLRTSAIATVRARIRLTRADTRVACVAWLVATGGIDWEDALLCFSGFCPDGALEPSRLRARL
jgi:hypothetical protein